MGRKTVCVEERTSTKSGNEPGGVSGRTGEARRILALLLAAAGTLVLLPARAGGPAAETPCHKKCLESYEQDGGICGKIKNDEPAYIKCHNEAYERYKGCRAKCTQQQQNDCLEHCKDLCYQIMDKCKGDCKDDPNPRECRSRCTNEYADCLRECDRKCKGK
jgi:hypothetical protein